MGAAVATPVRLSVRRGDEVVVEDLEWCRCRSGCCGRPAVADVQVTLLRPPWHRSAVLAALMLAAFTFNTAENLPIGLLELISESLRVSVPAVGLLATGYGMTVAVASSTS